MLSCGVSVHRPNNPVGIDKSSNRIRILYSVVLYNVLMYDEKNISRISNTEYGIADIEVKYS